MLSSGPCGWKARPVEPDQRLEASPARGAGNPHREAWTASPKAMLLSAERPLVGALAFVIPGATLRHRNGLVSAVPPASTEHGERTFGVPRNLGDPASSSASSRTGDRVNNSRPRRRTRPPGSEENEWTRGYRQAKETKCGGMGGRES